ncbi:ABC transporter substrate-binding protein [Acuticoccus sp. MNP-M23]|uniref:ABC transporter substrate-binding protein n=1 Tax=Acuticoccus sp. MNP-M23 TaxID=3072793 RepID=UPI002815C7E7|nr:ABC transporter substrate-binding protein [Acuticoccus sp. MNP-M23]WMS44129.1 ABC transporter substrate-binding protein [Acuticoccus sp. MNP-M23]
MRQFIVAGAAGALSLLSVSASAEPLSLLLNWTPAADHAPIYYALDNGLYEEAGIELTVEPGKGSGMAAQNVGVGAKSLGIAELGTAFLAKSKGADLVAVMAIYANSPFTLYWRKSSGIEGPADFAGHTLGNPSGDAARVMWPAFAKAAGIPEDGVSFVNIAPAAKIPTLAAGRVDIISDFYNGHDQKIETLGDDLGSLRWSEVGLNPYGNSIIVNGEFLSENKDMVARFVDVTQQAYRTCAEDIEPCIAALMNNASGLDHDAMVAQWGRIAELMTTEATVNEALGWFDPVRIQETYDLVNTYFELDAPFDPATAYTNDYLDTAIKMVE